MDLDIFSRTLPKLGTIATPALDVAVAQMVANKHACDSLARRNVMLAAVAGYGMELWPDGHHVPGGFGFFRMVFPFVQEGSADRGLSALVPARRTIGDAHRGYPETMPPEQLEATLALLQHPDRAVWGNQEYASYTWIKPLGVFLAGEGKNRVSLFQRLGIEWIPACVSTEDYPSPERIVLYVFKNAGAMHCWAVLDSRWTEYLANPMWALPVLQAYGVKVEAHWPSEFPPLAAVKRAFGEIADGQPGAKKSRIDLDIVRAQESWEDEQEEVSPLSLLSLVHVWKWLPLWASVVAASALSLLIAPSNWTVVRLAAMGLLAAAGGALFTAQARFIPLRRRHVRTPLSYRAWARNNRARDLRQGASSDTGTALRSDGKSKSL